MPCARWQTEGVSGRLVGPAAFKAVEALYPQRLVGSIPIHSRRCYSAEGRGSGRLHDVMGARDSNSPGDSRGQPHIPGAGAAKSAASGGDSGTGTASGAHPGPGAGSGGTPAAVLAMVDWLPLTPAEKVDAVRRLLADQAARGKP
jgi:hypothetical protein